MAISVSDGTTETFIISYRNLFDDNVELKISIIIIIFGSWTNIHALGRAGTIPLNRVRALWTLCLLFSYIRPDVKTVVVMCPKFAYPWNSFLQTQVSFSFLFREIWRTPKRSAIAQERKGEKKERKGARPCQESVRIGNKYRGGTSDATSSSSFIVPLIMTRSKITWDGRRDRRMDPGTDGPRDGPTDGHTRPLIEMRSRI